MPRKNYTGGERPRRREAEDLRVELTQVVAREFRVQLQKAREDALRDAEAFGGIIHAIERLGSSLSGSIKGLGSYQLALEELARRSPLAEQLPHQWRGGHIPFGTLLNMIRAARNDAMHVGAAARHLTAHAIEAALVLEDALRTVEMSRLISDYMIRDPVCAHLWEPVSLVRQKMLSNSFSYLPIRNAENAWRLISDLQIAKYLQCASNGQRSQRLATPLGKAEIELLGVICVEEARTVEAVIPDFDGRPILVVRQEAREELLGIVTAFDLL